MQKVGLVDSTYYKLLERESLYSHSDHILKVRENLQNVSINISNVFNKNLQSVLFAGELKRSKLTLILAESFGIPIDKTVFMCTAMELLHEASLVHDDIQDCQLIRRGNFNTLAILGSSQAINLGDFLISECSNSILKSDMFNSHEKIKILKNINEIFSSMIKGQVKDLSPRGDFCMKTYWETVDQKTGALLSLPPKLLDLDTKVHYLCFLVARLYQIKNDLEDFLKGEDSLDFKNKRKTYPIIKLFNLRKSKEDTFWKNSISENEKIAIKQMTQEKMKELECSLVKQTELIVSQFINFESYVFDFFNVLNIEMNGVKQ